MIKTFEELVNSVRPTEKTQRNWVKLLLLYTAKTFDDSWAYQEMIKMHKEDKKAWRNFPLK